MDRLKILFLASDPTDLARLRLGHEVREIREKLQLSKHRNDFSLQERSSVRPGDIIQAIYDVEPQIVHFAGHGTSTGELCFENDLGKMKPVQPEALANLFKLFDEQVSCVVLNACYSEIQAQAISKFIPVVIGMSRPIGDRAAIKFATGFYRGLGAGQTFEKAYKAAQVEMQLEDNLEYLTPTLYTSKNKFFDISSLRYTSEAKIKFTEEELKSEQGIDYSKLQACLKVGNWREADYETYLLMLRVVQRDQGDWIRNEEMLKFPCSELRIIDKLWIGYSEGRFGFSVQNKIWLDIQSQNSFFTNPLRMPGKDFALRIGWCNARGLYKERDDLDFSPTAPQGHLPCTLRGSGRLRKETGYWLFSPLAERLNSCAIG
jgi:GUN4-like/CHAT domain